MYVKDLVNKIKQGLKTDGERLFDMELDGVTLSLMVSRIDETIRVISVRSNT